MILTTIALVLIVVLATILGACGVVLLPALLDIAIFAFVITGIVKLFKAVKKRKKK